MTEETLRVFIAIAAVIGSITGPAGVIIAAWIVARLGKVETKVDGMSTALVEATAGQNRAEGQLKERDAQRAHMAESKTIIAPIISTDDDPLKVEIVKGKDE